MKLTDIARLTGVRMNAVQNWIARGLFPVIVDDRSAGKATLIPVTEVLRVARFIVVADALGSSRAFAADRAGLITGRKYEVGRVSIDTHFPDLHDERCERAV